MYIMWRIFWIAFNPPEVSAFLFDITSLFELYWFELMQTLLIYIQITGLY